MVGARSRAMRSRRRSPLSVAVGAVIVLAACGGGRSVVHAPRRRATTSEPTESVPAKPPPTTVPPVQLDPDVAALPDGHGSKLSIVVDDNGFVDTYLAGYLSLPIPITMSIIPFAPRASQDDATIHASGKEVMLHIPLANGPGPTEPGRLAVGATPIGVAQFVDGALARVPDAVGANNHEGPYGSASPALMSELLASLRMHHLFFMDSVTTQRTVGFSLLSRFGMAPRINNVFMDHFENDNDSRAALLRLAGFAALNGGAIGICHVFHPYELHALQTLAAQLEAKGYVFAPLSQVTDQPVPGLDTGVRTG